MSDRLGTDCIQLRIMKERNRLDPRPIVQHLSAPLSHLPPRAEPPSPQPQSLCSLSPAFIASAFPSVHTLYPLSTSSVPNPCLASSARPARAAKTMALPRMGVLISMEEEKRERKPVTLLLYTLVVSGRTEG